MKLTHCDIKDSRVTVLSLYLSRDLTVTGVILRVSVKLPQRDIMAWAHGGYLFIVADIILLRKGRRVCPVTVVLGRSASLPWSGASVRARGECPRGNCCGPALASRPFIAVTVT